MKDESPEIQVLIDNKNIINSKIQEAYLDRVKPPIDMYETACKRLVISELFRGGIQRDDVVSFFSFLTKTISIGEDPYTILDRKYKESLVFKQVGTAVIHLINRLGNELLSQYELLDPIQYSSIIQASNVLSSTQLSQSNKDSIEMARTKYIQTLEDARVTREFIKQKGGNSLSMFIAIVISGIPIMEKLKNNGTVIALVFYLSLIMYNRTGCFKNVGQDSTIVDCDGFFKNPINAEYCDCGTAPVDTQMSSCDGNEDMVFCRQNCKNVYMKNCLFQSDTIPVYYSFKQPSPYQMTADIIEAFYSLRRHVAIDQPINYLLIIMVGLSLGFIWIFLARI